MNHTQIRQFHCLGVNTLTSKRTLLYQIISKDYELLHGCHTIADLSPIKKPIHSNS